MADALGARPASAAGAENTTAPLPFDCKAVLARVVQMGASDLHLKLGRAPLVRMHGELTPLDQPSMTAEDLQSVAAQLCPPQQLREFENDREADFAVSLPGVGRFRVNMYQQRGTIAFVLRNIAFQSLSMRDLHLPPVLEEIAQKPRGLVLVTGVTGSGKSTALASMIQYINERKRANIITIEDPVEFLHRDVNCNINQREVGNDTMSFAAALRHVLRQDPDIILIGEIRDLETFDIALKAANTGHLVFSTLHTTDAAQTINRVLSFYPPHQQADVRFSLSTALQAVVSLRLVPRADGTGRVPACEVLINTAAVADQIRDLAKSLNIPDLIRQGTAQYGMQSFDQSLMGWYTTGVISYESAMLHATNPSEFALKAQGIAGSSDSSWDSFTQ